MTIRDDWFKNNLKSQKSLNDYYLSSERCCSLRNILTSRFCAISNARALDRCALVSLDCKLGGEFISIFLLLDVAVVLLCLATEVNHI